MMSQFTEHRDYDRLEGIKYRLTRDLVWEVGKKGSGLFVTVPTGYVFDSSIPRIMRWLISPHHPQFLLPAALHDFMLDEKYDSGTAASQWHQAAIATGMSFCMRFLCLMGILLYTVR